MYFHIHFSKFHLILLHRSTLVVHNVLFVNQCFFFRLDHVPAKTVTCGDKTKQMQLPGDFSSDAQFFVFTGVLSFLATMGILVVYVFFSELYLAESKMAPMIVSSSNFQTHHMTKMFVLGFHWHI